MLNPIHVPPAPRPDTRRAGHWPVQHLGPADAADVCRLFEQVFGQPMSVSFHAWKYADGRGMATGMRDDQGQLVSHYGGTLRVMQWGSAVFTGAQVGDVMVASHVRDVFAKFGPFGRVARAFIRHYLGEGRPYPIGFGFPNQRAALLGRRLGLYWPATQMLAWQWPRAVWAVCDAAAPLPNPSVYRMLDLHQAADAVAIDQWLMPSLHHDLSRQDMLWPVRGSDWWRHRYTNHPHFSYRVYGVTAPTSAEDSLWRGALVLRVNEDTGTWELMDWVGPLAFTAEVLHHASVLCAAADGRDLEMWCTPAVAAHLSPIWTERGSSSVACEVVVNDAQVLGRPIALLQDRCWLTGGDTDFR